jgi:hypothetical protein
MMYGNAWNATPAYMFNGWGLAGAMGAWLGILLVPFILWSIFWKGWALWRAAKNDSQVWFIVLLIVNTLGILDILYIFVFGKQKRSRK